MKQLQGKYCKDCKISTDNIEDEAVELIQSMLDQRPFECVFRSIPIHQFR